MSLTTQERAEFDERRAHGLKARHAAKLARTPVRCRYIDDVPKGLCTAEAADRDGEIKLCTKHLALTLELLRSRGFYIEAPHGA